MRLRLFCVILLLLSLSSCVSYEKLVYLQSEKLEGQEIDLKEYTHRLRPNDVLRVEYISKFPQLTEFPNQAISGTQERQRYMGFEAQEPLMQGYIIRDDGTIELPLIEEPLNVAGLTVEEAQFKVQQEILQSFDDMMVRLNLINFYVTILGEVNRPGRYTIYDRQITIFEVISMAGEPTIAANRRKVRLMRRENGKVETHLIDMTKEDFVSSEYFYLHSDDVIYIEPLPGVKAVETNRGTIGLVSTILSSLVLISNLIFAFSRN